MVWPIVALVVALVLVAIPIWLLTRRPAARPNANWVSVVAEVIDHEPGANNATYPVVRYATPDRDGTVQTAAALAATPEQAPVGEQLPVLLDPLNPVQPFPAELWRAAERRRAIISGVCLVVAAVAIAYATITLGTS